MLIKMFKWGTGPGSGPINYLLGNTDSEGQPRGLPPEVLSGHPERTKAIIDCLETKWKYTSGVLSFHEADKPTGPQLQALMRSFEDLAFASKGRESHNILWVKHTSETGRVELHFVIPRVDLRTGKQFNPFPPGWVRDFKDWKNYQNLQYGWASPDDPARARPRTLGDIRCPNHAVKHEITRDLMEEIQAGRVGNRDDILKFISDRGYSLLRREKDYLLVVNKNGVRARLLGGIFHEKYGNERSEERTSQGTPEKSCAVRLSEAESGYRAALERRGGAGLSRITDPERIDERQRA